MEALFVLRCIVYALRQRSDTLALCVVDRFGRFILWLFFFPTLVMGPVYSYRDFYQSYQPAIVNRRQLVHSVVRKLLWGSVKLALLAPSTRTLYKRLLATATLGPASRALPLLSHLDPRLLIWAAFCVDLVNLYVAFSAFIDIVIGVSRLLGFNLYENFDKPLLSTSPVRYWKTMDISVYRWMMTHVFYPYWGHTRITAKVITTFMASALFHLIIPLHFSWDAMLQIGLVYAIRSIVVAALMKLYRIGWGIRPTFVGHHRWVGGFVWASQVALTFSFTALTIRPIRDAINGVSVVTTMQAYCQLFFGLE